MFLLGLLVLLVVQCVNSDSPDLVGRACVTDGIPGRCTPWRQCQTLVFDKRDNNLPGVCSYNGFDPVICCTSCHLVDDISKAVIGRGGNLLWKNEHKSWNKCLSYMEKLPYGCADGHLVIEKQWSYEKKCHCATQNLRYFVLGGKEAARAEFPHMALLGFGSAADGVVQWDCSGSIISEWFILTAAHCMSNKMRVPVSLAAVGILKRSDPEELWTKYMIEQRLPHPEYRPPSKYHDIALLKTDRTIAFGRNVLPACLPHQPVYNSNEQLSTTYFLSCDDHLKQFKYSWNDNITHVEATALGWGATGHRTAMSDTLQSVSLQAYNSSECLSLYGIHRHLSRGYDHATQMCYGHREQMRDTCDGDSGGPLQVNGDALWCQYKIIGVTSFGQPCGTQKRSAGVYTRVLHYVPWIEDIVWPDF